MNNRPIDSPESFPGWIMPWPSFHVDWSQAALLIVDMQNYSSNPSCGIGRMLAERYPDVADYYLPRIRHSISNCA